MIAMPLLAQQGTCTLFSMPRKRLGIADEIRAAVNAAGVSREQICRDTGIDRAGLSRFMAETGRFLLPNLERLAEYLDLELRPRKGAGRNRR